MKKILFGLLFLAFVTTVNAQRILGENTLITKGEVNPNPSTLTDGSTITWDITTGLSKYVTLGGNRTLAFSNLANAVGRYLYLKVIQDGTGSRTLTLPASCKVANGGSGAITLTTTASAFDIITFYVFSSSEVHVSWGRNFN